MDLSLEFPSRYQVPTGSSMFADSHPCSIEGTRLYLERMLNIKIVKYVIDGLC